MTPEQNKMGFPEGMAEKMVLKAFRSYPFKYPNKDSLNTDNISNTLPESTHTTVSHTSTTPKIPQIQYNSDGKQIPIGNGGITHEYMWTQTIEDISINFILPSNNINTKDIIYKPTSKHLYLKIGTTIIDKDWSETVQVDDITWSVDKEQGILIMEIDKNKKVWWGSVFKGDSEIDLTKVDSERPINTYDKDTQAAIRRIMVFLIDLFFI